MTCFISAIQLVCLLGYICIKFKETNKEIMEFKKEMINKIDNNICKYEIQRKSAKSNQ